MAGTIGLEIGRMLGFARARQWHCLCRDVRPTMVAAPAGLGSGDARRPATRRRASIHFYPRERESASSDVMAGRHDQERPLSRFPRLWDSIPGKYKVAVYSRRVTNRRNGAGRARTPRERRRRAAGGNDSGEVQFADTTLEIEIKDHRHQGDDHIDPNDRGASRKTTDERPSSRVHPDRALVVIAVICRLGRVLAAGRPGGARNGPTRPVHQQPQANRPGHARISRPTRQLASRGERVLLGDLDPVHSPLHRAREPV